MINYLRHISYCIIFFDILEIISRKSERNIFFDHLASISEKKCFLGIEVLKQFREEIDNLEAERQELASAERLFDLSITMYPELLQVQKEMKGLEQIYKLYQEQTVSREAILELCFESLY